MTRVFFLLFTTVFLGCNLDNRSKMNMPNPKEMAKILAEVHLAESTVATLNTAKRSGTDNSYYKSVLVRHGLSLLEFDSAVAYYSSKPDEYVKIYEDVIEIITAKELEVKALKDDINIDDAKSLPKAVAFDANNFWGKNRSLVINSSDSTRSKSEFEISTDSILGGSIILTVKCQLRSKLKLRSYYKNRIKVEYNDGSTDSTSMKISSKTLFKDISTTLKLSDNKRVKRVLGSLIVLNEKDALVADFVDIRLKWSRPKELVKLNLKNVR